MFPKSTAVINLLRCTSRLLTAVLALAIVPASFTHAEGPAVAVPAARTHSLTNAMLEQSVAHQRSGADPNRVPPALLRVAAERQQAFAALIEANPADALRLAIPPDLRQGLPAPLRGYVEENVQLAGTLEVRYVHYERGSRQVHLLHANGKQYSLHFNSKPPELLTGSRVRVKAVRSGSALLLDSGSSGGATALLVDAPALANTFGDQRTLVLLVNFADNTTQPWTATQVSDAIFGSVSNYMREASFQQTWLSGNVYGWYTLPFASSCVGTDIATAARAAAAGAGVNLAAYARTIYLFPRNTTCGWSGMGTVGGMPSEAWINGKLDTKTIGHEMGHNFGLQHSRAWECGATSEGSGCTNLDYGDTLDIMGNTNAAHFNTFQKERLGWLNYNGAPPIVTVENGGSFSLEPYETASGGAKALKVLKGVDATTGRKSWYYVEYRQALGFDAFLTGNANVLGGVVIRTGADGDSYSSYLLDQTPNSSVYYDWDDTALTGGRSFTGSNGVTISTLSAGGSAAGVSVSFGPQTCVRANPAVAMTPSQSSSVAPGTAVAFVVTVTNRDSSGCSASQFDLGSGVPSGWNAAYTSQSLNLAPGASASATLTVSSSASASVGIYNVVSSAFNHALSSYTASSAASYVVGSSANQPPVARNDSATTPSATPVTIDVLTNDYDPEGKPLTLLSVTQAAHGTVAISGAMVIYTPRGKFKGSDSFSYTVSDGSASTSASVSVTVQASTGGGKH